MDQLLVVVSNKRVANHPDIAEFLSILAKLTRQTSRFFMVYGIVEWKGRC